MNVPRRLGVASRAGGDAANTIESEVAPRAIGRLKS
jgi:hypothetical protein